MRVLVLLFVTILSACEGSQGYWWQGNEFTCDYPNHSVVVYVRKELDFYKFQSGHRSFTSVTADVVQRISNLKDAAQKAAMSTCGHSVKIDDFVQASEWIVYGRFNCTR